MTRRLALLALSMLALASTAFAADADMLRPMPPTVALSYAGTARVDLVWDAALSEASVAAYRVERSAADGEWTAVASTPDLYWKDLGLAADADYWYRVVARDEAGLESETSNVLHVHTAPDRRAVAASEVEPMEPVACAISIPRVSYGEASGILFVKAVSTEPNATLEAHTNDDSIGVMLQNGPRGAFTLRRHMDLQPACITVTSSCGGSQTFCF